MPGAAYPLSREEFLYTPELEGFEFVTLFWEQVRKEAWLVGTS